MLVLARRIGEVVHVGDAAVIVLEIRFGQVKLGFDFPRETRILRSEIETDGPNEAAVRCVARHHRRDREGE